MALCNAFRILRTIFKVNYPKHCHSLQKEFSTTYCNTDVCCCCGNALTRSTASLWIGLNLCWRNAVVVSFQFWNPLVTKASSALFARIVSSLNAFTRVWQTTQSLLPWQCSTMSTSRTRLLETSLYHNLFPRFSFGKVESYQLVWFFNDWRAVLEFTQIKNFNIASTRLYCSIRNCACAEWPMVKSAQAIAWAAWAVPTALQGEEPPEGPSLL